MWPLGRARSLSRSISGSYTNRDGQKVYTTDVVLEEQEFAESKRETEAGGNQRQSQDSREPVPDENGFMSIPDGIDEELPFN